MLKLINDDNSLASKAVLIAIGIQQQCGIKNIFFQDLSDPDLYVVNSHSIDAKSMKILSINCIEYGLTLSCDEIEFKFKDSSRILVKIFKEDED